MSVMSLSKTYEPNFIITAEIEYDVLLNKSVLSLKSHKSTETTISFHDRFKVRNRSGAAENAEQKSQTQIGRLPLGWIFTRDKSNSYLVKYTRFYRTVDL